MIAKTRKRYYYKVYYTTKEMVYMCDRETPYYKIEVDNRPKSEWIGFPKRIKNAYHRITRAEAMLELL